MFETFYGMDRTPFSRNIPPENLYPSIMLEEALGRLGYAAERQLFAVVTGSSGHRPRTWTRLLFCFQMPLLAIWRNSSRAIIVSPRFAQTRKVARGSPRRTWRPCVRT